MLDYLSRLDPHRARPTRASRRAVRAALRALAAHADVLRTEPEPAEPAYAEPVP